jgi:hypothetical protein
MTELYDRYRRLTYSLTYRMVHDVGIAEDLVQDTFLRVWNRTQGFDVDRGALEPVAAGRGTELRDRLPAFEPCRSRAWATARACSMSSCRMR